MTGVQCKRAAMQGVTRTNGPEAWRGESPPRLAARC